MTSRAIERGARAATAADVPRLTGLGVGLSAVSIAILIAAGPVSARAQLLDRASSAVRGGSDDDDDDDRDSGSSYGQDDDDEDDGGSFLDSASDTVRGSGGSSYSSGSSGYGRSRGRAGSYGGGGYGGPYGGSSGPRSRYVLGVHPYAADCAGYGYVSTDDTDLGRAAVRVELEAGYALGGAGRGGASARIQLPIPLDLTVRYSVFAEPAEPGVQVAALGRFGLEWRFLDTPVIQLRLGGGGRHFQDAAGGMFGLDVLFGMDVFPGAPLVITVEGGVGFVGQAIVAQVRGTIGATVDSFEIYGGYDYEGLLAGGVHVDLGGPMIGLRLWL
jgi:hypothetical protein